MGAPRSTRKRGRRYRSAATGQVVSAQTAAASPGTTVSETIRERVRIHVRREVYDEVCIALHDAGVYGRDPGRYPGLPSDAVDLGEVVLVVEAGG